MNIAIIGTTAHSILGFRVDLIKALVAKGHTVYAFAQDYQVHTKQQVSELGAVAVPYQFNRTGLNPFVDLFNTYQLVKQLKKYSIEQTFCYFTKPVIFGTLAAILAGVKRRYAMLEGLGFTFTPQPNGIPFKTKLLKRIQVVLYRCVLPRLNRLILLNNDDKKDLVDCYNIKVNVSVLGAIGLNLLDYPYSKPQNNPISFLFIGRLLREKGIFEYVQAAKLIKAKYPFVTFYILGCIDTENPGGLSENQLSQLIADKVVIWPGFVSNIADWLQQASIFVLPSYYREGFPRSTQEAMAIGRAVITTDVPGCRETVQEGVNGFLVAPYSATEIADRMAYFIDHPEKIIEMGNNSYHIAQQHFNAEEVNKRLVDLLDLS